MRLTLISASMALSLALGACGSQNAKNGNEDSVQEFDAETEQALAAEFSGLPEGVMIRVELDANGNELVDTAQMVTYNGAVSEENASQAFASGNIVSDFIDGDNSLDDSSTASWFKWLRKANDNSNGQRGLININIGGRFNQQSAQSTAVGGLSSVGSSGRFASYRPSYRSSVYNGGYYSYGQPNCFSKPSYRIYHYPRACVGYNYCSGYGSGYESGYGYGYNSSYGYGSSW